MRVPDRLIGTLIWETSESQKGALCSAPSSIQVRYLMPLLANPFPFLAHVPGNLCT